MQGWQEARLRRLEGWTAWLLLAASVSLNVALVVSRTSEPRARGSSVSIPDGFQLPTLELTDRGGLPVRVKSTTARNGTLVYVFHPDCAWCKRNRASFSALAAKAKADHRILLIALSADAVEGAVAPEAGGERLYAGPNSATLRALGNPPTPTTYLLRPDGTVRRVWTGAYGGRTKDSIEREFNVSLPAISSPAESTLRR